MLLLVIEDEPRMAAILKTALGRAGFVTDTVAMCADARATLTVNPYDAAILDLGRQDGDGLCLLRELRSAANPIPILVLSARDSVEDRVRGLNAGADDYLTKPFMMIELIARTKALLRRPGGALGTMLKAGNINFDTIGRNTCVGTTPLALPRRETAVLEQLMRRMGRVVPRTVLEDKLYGLDCEVGSNAIQVHVHFLRHKLAEAGATAEIHTVRGVGYLLAEIKS